MERSLKSLILEGKKINETQLKKLLSKMGFSTLKEVQKEKRILARLESIMKEYPDFDVSEDTEEDEIEKKEIPDKNPKKAEEEPKDNTDDTEQDDSVKNNKDSDLDSDKKNKNKEMKTHVMSFDDFLQSQETNESLINEGDIKSDKDFKEWATKVLKKAHGENFDENKAKEVIDGLLSKYDDDYGAAVGALSSSLGSN